MIEACPFAGIIQIKFNGNFSERVMPKQSSNTRHAHIQTYNCQISPFPRSNPTVVLPSTFHLSSYTSQRTI
jgi:hypothetical protein